MPCMAALHGGPHTHPGTLRPPYWAAAARQRSRVTCAAGSLRGGHVREWRGCDDFSRPGSDRPAPLPPPTPAARSPPTAAVSAAGPWRCPRRRGARPASQ